MVRNKFGGSNHKKQASKNSNRKFNKSLYIKDKNADSSELYGKITKKCGGRPPHLDVQCEDGVSRRCVVRGKMTKRVWMNPGDFVVIIYNRESSDKKGEVYHKYSEQDIVKLKKLSEINMDMFLDEHEKKDDSGIVFDDGKNDKIEIHNLKTNKNNKVMISDLDKKDDIINFDDI